MGNIKEQERTREVMSQEMGYLSDLSTTAKTSLVDAMNEVVGTIGGTNIVGTLAALDTTAKTNVVAAINEVVADIVDVTEDVTANAAIVGALASLTTTDKTSIVAAINELVAAVEALQK